MKKILIAILGVIFVAGCIGETPVTTTGYGLEITNITLDRTEVYSDSIARLTMTIENKGDAKVLDEESLAYLIGSNVNFNDISGYSWVAVDPDDEVYQYFNKDMDPADIIRNRPADTKVLYWRLLSPTLPAGQSRVDKFIGRIYYEYETILRGNLWIYSEAESDAVRGAGGTFETSNFTSTSGPVSVELTLSPDPAILISEDDSFVADLKIKNIGGGIVYKRNSVDYDFGDVSLNTEELNQVYVSIRSPGMDFEGCEGYQELIGNEITLICDVTVDSLPATKSGFSPQITVSYGYYTDKEATITVLGR